MTLVISVLTDRAVLQVSDRRMTWLDADGSTRPGDDNRNKAVVLGKRMIIAYTGLGNLGPMRQRTDEWLAMALHECALDGGGNQADLLDCLAAKASERLNHSLYKRLGAGQRAHEFAVCGWARFPDSNLTDFRPYFAWVSNIRAVDGSTVWPPARDFSTGYFQLKPPDDYQLITSGQALDQQHEQKLREDIAQTNGGLETIADLLIHHVRRAADTNDAIGKGVLLTVLPRAAVIEGDTSMMYIMGGPIDEVPVFLSVPADSSDPRRYGPHAVSPGGGVITGFVAEGLEPDQEDEVGPSQ